MYRHQRLFLLIILLIPLASTSAQPKHEFEKMVRIFSEPPSTPRTKLSKLPSLKSISLLTLEQRNQIAVLISKSMFEEPNERSSYYTYLIIELNRNRLITTTEVIPILNQFAVFAGKSISQSRSAAPYAEWLKDLSENRLINTPEVLPYLIEALDNPDQVWVARRAFSALTLLTLHNTGRIYWGRSVEDPTQHRLISQWWKDWWEKNKNRKPVFDLELESEVKAEMTRLATLIKENLRPKFSEMSYFIIPQFGGSGQPLIYELAYSPYNYSFISKPPNIENVWLLMEADFQTPDLPDEGSSNAEQQSFFDPSHAPAHLRNLEQEIYFRTIPGTDVFIRVRFASNNQTLIDALRKLMNQGIGVSR